MDFVHILDYFSCICSHGVRPSSNLAETFDPLSVIFVCLYMGLGNLQNNINYIVALGHN